MEHLLTLPSLLAFLTLVALELVLGIDNVIFIALLAGKLPVHLQAKARKLGIGLAVVTRILLLLSLSWVIGLVEPLFTIFERSISGRDLILILGGAFLIGKSTLEIHHKVESVPEKGGASAVVYGFWPIVAQILLLDIVFSLDSVITAVGMVSEIAIMIAAVLVSTVFMVFTSGPITVFIEKHPTLKMLALSFLLLIGVTLVADGLGQHFSKSYIYFAMCFSLFIEVLNTRVRRGSSAH